MLEQMAVDKIIMNALEEDLGWGDATTDSTVSPEVMIKGNFIAKQDGILCGIEVCRRVFELLDGNIVFELFQKEGGRIAKGDIIAAINGKARAILRGERTALNLLQRMSGIATAAGQYAGQLAGFKARLVDTRKTAPGLRILDKYAVRTGGGYNHRFNLSDMVLIKDNHIKAAGGITPAVRAAKEKVSHALKIEVEVETIPMLEEAIAAGADIIMLDNMTLDMMKEAVRVTNGRALLEASGNVTLEGEKNIKAVAGTGVDIISVGALTNSVKAMDISLRFL